jgi:hypothetical protein
MAQARILWSAMLASQVIIGAVFWFLHLTQPVAGAPEVVGWALCALGTVMPLAAGVVQSAVQRSATTDAARVPGFVIGSALRESGAIMAAVALFLVGQPVLWAVPAAVAFGAQLTAYPRDTGAPGAEYRASAARSGRE